MKIYAIILNYKNKDITIECVSSLRKCKLLSNLELKILVVDNDSSDGIERALSTNYPDVEFLQTGANLGYTGGNNAGIRYILERTEDVQPEIVKNDDGEQNYFLILNNDTKLQDTFIIELAAAAKRHPKAGIVAPKIYFSHDSYPKTIYDEKNAEYRPTPQEEVLWYAGGIFDWENIIGKHRGVDQVDHGQWDLEEQTDYATGCALLIPFSVMKKVKGFDNNYFMYYEDVDLNTRIKKLGYQVWYAPKATMWHTNAKSSGVGSPLQDYFTTRNRLLFAMKFASLRTKFAILREAFTFRNNPTKWKGVKDFFLLRFEKGSFDIK